MECGGRAAFGCNMKYRPQISANEPVTQPNAAGATLSAAKSDTGRSSALSRLSRKLLQQPINIVFPGNRRNPLRGNARGSEGNTSKTNGDAAGGVRIRTQIRRLQHGLRVGGACSCSKLWIYDHYANN